MERLAEQPDGEGGCDEKQPQANWRSPAEPATPRSPMFQVVLSQLAPESYVLFPLFVICHNEAPIYVNKRPASGGLYCQVHVVRPNRQAHGYIRWLHVNYYVTTKYFGLQLFFGDKPYKIVDAFGTVLESRALIIYGYNLEIFGEFMSAFWIEISFLDAVKLNKILL